MTDAISRSAVVERLQKRSDMFRLDKRYETVIRDAIGEVFATPALDVAPVVRCGDCRWYDSAFNVCSKCGVCVNRDFYCADGEKEATE